MQDNLSIAIASLVLVCVVILGIIIYIIVQAENQAKIDEIENYLPRNIADEWNVQCRFLIHSALKQMNGLCFVSSELIYRIFNNKYNIKQVLVNIMNAMSSPLLSNNANDILSYVYNKLRKNFGDNNGSDNNGSDNNGSDNNGSDNNGSDIIENMIIMMAGNDTAQDIIDDIVKDNVSLANWLNKNTHKYVKVIISDDNRQIEITQNEPSNWQNLKTRTLVKIKNNTLSQYKFYLDKYITDAYNNKQNGNIITLDQQISWVSKLEGYQQINQNYHEQFSRIYEGYRDFPTHDINNYSYLSKPFIPDYNYIQYSPGYVDYNRDNWKYF